MARCFILLLLLWAQARAAELTVVTYVQTPDQVRKAEVLIASLRRFGGAWREAPVHVVAGDPLEVPVDRLKDQGVILHPTDAPEKARTFPYAIKAFAAAQVETLLKDEVGTLAWFDPESLVLAPPRDLALTDGRWATLQPVFKANAVALAEDRAPDAFWGGILAEVGLKAGDLPQVRTRVEGMPIRAYYNCEIFAVRPALGLLRAWRKHLAARLEDASFLRTACADATHRIFLHQAVLSACVSALVPAARLAPLPMAAAYPLNLHAALPEAARARTTAGLQALILEQVWDQDPAWRSLLGFSPEQSRWLEQAWTRYHELTPGVFREEHGAGCNSLLVRTSEGDVLVDAGGTLHPESFLWMQHQGGPLKAVILTHGHGDHTAGLDRWAQGSRAPVLAHRSQGAFLATLDRIAPLLERRGAMLQGRPPEEIPPGPTPLRATTLFDERHVLKAGEASFELIHVGGETPDTTLVWMPRQRVLCIGDDFFRSFPALSTPRGTQPRPAGQYLDALDRALALAPEVLVPGHGEPVEGREHVQRQLKRYRDALAWVRGATLKGLNEGRTVEELVQSVRLPGHLRLPEGYGRVAWAVRAIALEHVGWYDGRTTSLFEVPPSAIFPDLVEAAGGPERILERAAVRLEAGCPLEALHLLDVLPVHDASWRQLRLRALQALRALSANHFQRAFLAAEIRDLEAARDR